MCHQQLPLIEKDNIQLIWQTGKYYFPQAKEAVEKLATDHIIAVSFINRMDLAYAMADIIVSRAGAIAISEICAIGKPPIFIPLPTAAEDHQTKNANALVENHAAIMVSNQDAEDKLYDTIKNLIADKDRQRELSANLLKLAKTNAAEKIAEEIIKLIKK